MFFTAPQHTLTVSVNVSFPRQRERERNGSVILTECMERLNSVCSQRKGPSATGLSTGGDRHQVKGKEGTLWGYCERELSHARQIQGDLGGSSASNKRLKQDTWGD